MPLPRSGPSREADDFCNFSEIAGDMRLQNKKQQKIPEAEASGNLLEVTTRFELVDEGFADPCLTTWPRHHIGSDCYHSIGAADEARTRYLHLGKVALYQMSYGRIFGAFTLAPASCETP